MKAIQCDPNFALKFLSKVVKPWRQRERLLSFLENGSVQVSELVNGVIRDLQNEVIWEVVRFTESILNLFSMVEVNLLAKVLMIFNTYVIKWQCKFCADKCKAHVKKAILITAEQCQTVQAVSTLE